MSEDEREIVCFSECEWFMLWFDVCCFDLIVCICRPLMKDVWVEMKAIFDAQRDGV